MAPPVPGTRKLVLASSIAVTRLNLDFVVIVIERWLALYRIAPDGVSGLPPYDIYPQPAELIPNSGVLSDPSRGSSEAGEMLLADAVDGVVDAIRTGFSHRPVADGR